MDVHHQWTKVLQLLSLWYDPNAAQSFLTSVLVWLQLFQQLSVYRSLQQQTDWLKERISLLLGGVQVKHLERFGPAQPIIEHCSNLSMFHKTLLTQQLYLHPRSLQGLSVLLDKYDVTLPLEDSNTIFCLLTWSWDQCFLSITAAILIQVCMIWDISLSPPVLALPNFSCSSRGTRRKPGAAHNAKACESGKTGSTLVSMPPPYFCVHTGTLWCNVVVVVQWLINLSLFTGLFLDTVLILSLVYQHGGAARFERNHHVLLLSVMALEHFLSLYQSKISQTAWGETNDLCPTPVKPF